jgi:hypothetical protein
MRFHERASDECDGKRAIVGKLWMTHSTSPNSVGHSPALVLEELIVEVGVYFHIVDLNLGIALARGPTMFHPLDKVLNILE